MQPGYLARNIKRIILMIELKGINKTYRRGNEEFTALKDISFTLEKGDFCSVIGASGAGKSTLLNILGGLIHPDTGTITFNGKNIYRLKDRDIAQYRKKHLGFMFQQFHLMPYLTVHENIRLACHEKDHLDKIDFYLDRCSLKGLKKRYPSELSVGEKQRTAFIRAIISNPDLLLADEPTGNLDKANSDILLGLVKEFNLENGTVIIASHDPGIARYANRSIKLDKGHIQQKYNIL
jgi:putative ABC transport system ATP-binding protein